MTRKATKKSAPSDRPQPTTSVGSLTNAVNRTESVPSAERTREALMASEIYAGRIIAGLYDTVATFRLGEYDEAKEELTGALSGIHCLAELLAAVGEATGVDLPAADQALGELAMSLHAIEVARAADNFDAVIEVIERDLVPSLSRLAPSFPQMEACIAGATSASEAAL
jgi:hypothetical protein